ncbi:MAG: hypothetical protein HQL44_16145 [Alphaproteobacteria bacterium]|nr:hypothetical protein [Alphaproteobacteria bacterium]
MGGFQFAHISTFSLRGNRVPHKNVKRPVADGARSARDIILESIRAPGNAPHVLNPQPPNCLFIGADTSTGNLLNVFENIVEEANARLKLKGMPKIRKDTHVLESMVFSHPAYTQAAPLGHIGEERPCLKNPDDVKSYSSWRDDTVEWAQKNARLRGLEVLMILEHTDEAHPHVHVLSVPMADPRLNAKNTHPGFSAKQEAIQNNEPGKIPNQKYREAMLGWQKDYYENVSIKHGLTRFGPRRRRLTRQEWRMEKAAAERTARTLKLARETERKANEILTKAKDEEEFVAEYSRNERLNLDSVATTTEWLNKQASKAKSEAENYEKQAQALLETQKGKELAMNAWIRDDLFFDKQGHPKLRSEAKQDAGAQQRHKLILAQASWVKSDLKTLDQRVSEVVTAKAEQAAKLAAAEATEKAQVDAQVAFAYAAQLWAQGGLLRRKKKDESGKNFFIYGNTAPEEVAKIEAMSSETKERIANFLDGLPNREKIAEAERLATELAPFVQKVIREKAANISKRLGSNSLA